MSAPVGVNRVRLTRRDPNKVVPDLLLYSNVIGGYELEQSGVSRTPAAQGPDLQVLHLSPCPVLRSASLGRGS
jgi:hypothetical protein